MIRVALALLAALSACGPPKPVAFHYGEDVCSHCHMTVADPSYAAQLVTTTGKVYLFDDLGCLAEFEVEGSVEAGMIHSRWVNRFLAPDSIIAVDQALFLHSAALHSPMGHGLAALLPSEADSLRLMLGGELLTWAEVLEGRRREGPSASG